MKYIVKTKHNKRTTSKEINSLEELERKIIGLKNKGYDLKNIDIYEVNPVNFTYKELLDVTKNKVNKKESIKLTRRDLSGKIKKGLETAINNGVKLGPPQTANTKLINELLDLGFLSYSEIAIIANCSKSTVHRMNN